MRIGRRGVCFFILVFLLNCFLGELVIRKFIYKYPQLRKDVFWGWIAQHDAVKVQGLEGFSRVRFNNLGLRGRDVAEIKREKRILVLGSSYTFAGEVKKDATFIALLEKKLRADGKSIQVINAGLPDASVAEFLHYLPWLVKRCQPDLIVIQLVPKDFSRALQRHSGVHVFLENDKGYSVVKSPAMSLKDRLIEQPVYRFFVTRSGLFAYLNIRIRNYLSVRQDTASFVEINAPSLQSEIIFQSKRLIRVILNEWSMYNVPISLLILPEGDAFRGLDSSSKEAALAQEIRENCDRLHLSCVDVKQAFSAEFATNHNLCKGFVNSIPGKGHLNRAGHRVVADQLFNAFKQVPL